MKKFIFLLISLFPAFHSFSQQNIQISKEAFRIPDREGFSAAWSSIQEAEQFFSQGAGRYNQALAHYLQALGYHEDFAPAQYKVGCCYLFGMDQPSNALSHFQKAVSVDSSVAHDLFFLMGYAHQLKMDPYQAKDLYNFFYDQLSTVEQLSYKEEIERRISQCKQMEAAFEKPLSVKIDNYGSKLNSANDDYNAIIHNNKIYFTSKRPGTTKGRRNPIDNKYFEDIYVFDRTQETVNNIGSPPNTAVNESIVGLSEDGMRIYAFHDKNGGDIVYADKEAGEWTAFKSFLPDIIGSEDAETSCVFGPEGRTLFFVSTHEGGVSRDRDIYCVKKDPEGNWGHPEYLRNINTEANEEAVSLSLTGDTLYFSSDSELSFGGYDIFYSVKDQNGEWGEPVNIGYPVNSAHHDLFFHLHPDGKHFSFSSIRKGGLGGLDIYKGVFLDRLIIKGQVRCKHQDTIIPHARVTFSDEKGKEIDVRPEVDKSGYYLVNMKDYEQIGIQVNAEKYMFLSEKQVIDPDQYNDTLFLTHFLSPIDTGVKIVLNNIYFAFNSHQLQPSSFSELDKLAGFMHENDSVFIKITGHTDHLGDYKYNKWLSGKRAEAVVNYLVEENGVLKSRISFEGKASDEPVASNDTEEGRMKNRRVEFEVLDPNKEENR